MKQKRYADAANHLAKSCWNAAMQDNAYLQLATIECRSGKWAPALEMSQKSLARNAASPKARHLKSFVLRKLNRLEEAKSVGGGFVIA